MLEKYKEISHNLVEICFKSSKIFVNNGFIMGIPKFSPSPGPSSFKTGQSLHCNKRPPLQKFKFSREAILFEWMEEKPFIHNASRFWCHSSNCPMALVKRSLVNRPCPNFCICMKFKGSNSPHGISVELFAAYFWHRRKLFRKWW